MEEREGTERFYGEEIAGASRRTFEGRRGL
jgi:hypothetical protein